MNASQPATITGFHGSLLVPCRLLFMLGVGRLFHLPRVAAWMCSGFV